MNFAIRKLRLAKEDALDAAIWYEKRQAGLGEDFLDEVDRAVQRLSGEALPCRIRFADVRRMSIRRFKFYGIYYVVRGEEAWVLAIFHGRRHPRSVQERVAQIG
jgi:plasmid stabilization system protein ParE